MGEPSIRSQGRHAVALIMHFNSANPRKCCCFSHSACWLPTRKITLYGGQPRSWSAEQGKESKIKSLAAHPFPLPTLLVRRKLKNIYYVTHLQALRRSRSISHPYKDSLDSSTRSKGAASPSSTLPCAITSFPVSFLPSSPGDD